MKRSSRSKRTLMTVLLGSTIFLSNPSMLLANTNAWQPQISEKILMLPSKHLEQAIERDFSTSVLAGDMKTLDQKIGSAITNITSLQDNQHLYDGEEALEAEHQIIVGKRNYLDLMGNQIELKRQQLDTKLRLYQRLMKQSKRNEAQNRDVQDLNLAIDEARVRSNAVETTLRDELFFATNQPESKFSQDYAENRSAIEALRSAIANHPANQQLLSEGQPITKADELRNMILETEAEIAVLSMEEEVIGHMAKLLSLDAMAFAEKLAEQAWQEQAATTGPSFLSPKENVKMFIAF